MRGIVRGMAACSACIRGLNMHSFHGRTASIILSIMVFRTVSDRARLSLFGATDSPRLSPAMLARPVVRTSGNCRVVSETYNTVDIFVGHVVVSRSRGRGGGWCRWGRSAGLRAGWDGEAGGVVVSDRRAKLWSWHDSTTHIHVVAHQAARPRHRATKRLATSAWSAPARAHHRRGGRFARPPSWKATSAGARERRRRGSRMVHGRPETCTSGSCT